MINLNIEPRVNRTREEFIRDYPPFSIALDGFVIGKPWYDRNGPRANLNHHEEVDRLFTRSTCEQTHIAIKKGLLDKFQKDGQPYVNLNVNDGDQDVCLSVWLFRNSERIYKIKSEPLITRLVAVQGLLDTTAGIYPIDPKMSIIHELAWIFEPYVNARMAGRVPFMDENETRNIIDTVGNRISEYTLGRGQKIEPDTRYREIAKGNRWAVIEEIGYYARSALFAKGINIFVAVKDRGDGAFSYSLGKADPYEDYSIEEGCRKLNQAEGIGQEETDRWSGGDMISGSPRIRGSRLKPEDIAKILF